jgi:hypothetical protein
MQKYIELPKKDVGAKVENEWYKICQKEQIPFITLKSRTKLADVHWDYITYPTNVDDILNDLNGQLRDNAIEIFMKYADKRSAYTANDHLVWFKNLEIEKAKIAAEELYDLVTAYIEGHKKA